jgi:hypothetical protein
VTDVVDSRSISSSRVSLVVELTQCRDAIMDFVKYIVRNYEERNNMHYDEIKVVSPDWAPRLDLCLGFLVDGGTHPIGVFDGFNLHLSTKDTLVRCDSILSTICGHWKDDLAKVHAIVKDGIPDWLPHEERLVDIKHPMVRDLLGNKAYGVLAGFCSTLQGMVDAAKSSHGVHVLPEAEIRQASESARLGNLTVAVTYCLYHLCIAMPKLKGAKMVASASESLIKELGNSFKALPDCMKAKLLELSTA